MSSDAYFNYIIPWNENETGSGDEETANRYDDTVFVDDPRSPTELETESHYHDGDSMIPLSESATEPVLNLVQALQRNLSEDFRKKIEEWERIKSGEVTAGGGYSGGGSSDGNTGPSVPKVTPSRFERKSSLPGLKKRKSDRKLEKYRAKYKDLNWIEKELSRVNKEKEKLDRERAKFEERIKYLRKCKEDAMFGEKGAKKEIFVRTSDGEFRFEGITDDFTRKLHEWETKKGLRPESSIMTLLDSSPGPSSCTTLGSPPSLSTSGFDQDKTPNIVLGRHSHQTRYPLNRCISRSENSLIDLQNGETIGMSTDLNASLASNKVTSTSLPSMKQPEPESEYESTLLSSIGEPLTNEADDSRRAHLIRQQQQVARQLFNYDPTAGDDQSTGGTIPVWGDSEKCMVTVNPDGSTIIVGSKQDIYEMTKDILGEAGDDGYISLLEANMFLLEKLNAKEEVCRVLETQLKQLDCKMDEMNEKHREEMATYREKLWEIHGNKSHHAEESDKMIHELKDRIEKLQLCSERLKADKEALEDSFNYHTEQQAKLAIELVGKMRNLREMSSQSDNDEVNLDSGDGSRDTVKCNSENVARLHDLSTRLLEKARELESALIERTRQICRLRWELLHREVSAMKMKTELHSSHLHDDRRTADQPTARFKRNRYGSRRSWSSSERLNYTILKGNQTGPDAVDSWIIGEDWPKIQKESNELSETVQQLKMELLKLASQAQSRAGSSAEYLDEEERKKLEGMKGFHELFSSPLMKDLIQDGKQRSQHQQQDDHMNRFTSSSKSTHHQHHHRTHPTTSSGDNFNSASGHEGSEDSSANDNERTAAYVIRLPRNRWRRSRDNVSSSSESSFKEEESFTAPEWCKPRTNSYHLRRAKPSFGTETVGVEVKSKDFPQEDGLGEGGGRVRRCVERMDDEREDGGDDSLESHRSTTELAKEMVLSYGNHSMSRSSSGMTDRQRTDSWGELCKRRFSIYNQFSETSSSAYNEGQEESSSTSVSNPFQTHYYYNNGTPNSTQSNLRSSISSGQDRYMGIPMIDEDYPSGSIPAFTGGSNSNDFGAHPEGQSIHSGNSGNEERRHSEPCRKFNYSIRPSVNRNLTCNSSISIAEVREDQSPSPVVYTIRLEPKRNDSTKSRSKAFDEDRNDDQVNTNNQGDDHGNDKSTSIEYVFCEPKENIFFQSILKKEASSVGSALTPSSSHPPIVDEVKPSSQPPRIVDTIMKSTQSVASIGCGQIDLLEPIAVDIIKRQQRSTSSKSLTSLGSEQSIVRPRSRLDSVTSYKEKDEKPISRSSSKSSLTSRVASFITRRSRSKSRPRVDESKQSAIGALCKKSIALTVNPEPVTTVKETSISNSPNVIVTEALASATSTATATISPSSSTPLLLTPSSSSSTLTSSRISGEDSGDSQFGQLTRHPPRPERETKTRKQSLTYELHQRQLASTEPSDSTFLSSSTIKFNSGSSARTMSTKDNQQSSIRKAEELQTGQQLTPPKFKSSTALVKSREDRKSSILNLFKSK